MNRAQCEIRPALQYRRDAFCHGLKRAGFVLVDRIANPGHGDLYVCWNRYGHWHEQATYFESRGASVLVAENAYLKDLLPDKWLSLALGDHAGHGRWPVGSNDRWDDLHIDLAPWRTDGTETLILQQRGIGSPSVRSPDNWAENTRRRYGGRIRPHPSDGRVSVRPLVDDLASARCVLTWGSSAALLALAYGVPVFHELKGWIGAGASRPLSQYDGEPLRDDEARLATFRRIIWAMWRLEDIQSGQAFRHLLGST